MKVLKSKRKKNTVELEIEASIETIEKGLTKTFKEYVKSANIPGFRKGKAPRSIFEKHYGKEILLKEGLSEAINIAYMKAIETENLQVVDYPQNMKVDEYKENSPIKFTCEVDVKPELKVEKYKNVKVETETTEISDDLVDAQIKQLQNTHVNYAPVDRAVEKEDLLKVNVKATIDNEPFSRWTKQNVGVGIGSSIFSEAFDNNLIGKKLNENVSFDVTYKDDHYLKEVAGKKVSFNVDITEVKGKEAPELNDDFIKSVTKFDTLDEYKQDIRSSLETQRKKDVDEKLKEDILTEIINKNPFDIPEGMVKQEIQMDKNYLTNTLSQSGANLESYLAMTKQTEEEFETKLKENATKRIQSQLILEAIEIQETIDVSDADITEEIKRLKPEADTEEKVADALNQMNQEGLKKMIKQRKVFDFLIEHAKISKKKA